jgi:hypothetical protein
LHEIDVPLPAWRIDGRSGLDRDARRRGVPVLRLGPGQHDQQDAVGLDVLALSCLRRDLEPGPGSGRAAVQRSALVTFMFRLVVTVRRGSACGIPDVWHHYPTLDEARTAAAGLLRHERVARIAVVRDEAPPAFVEWLQRS